MSGPRGEWAVLRVVYFTRKDVPLPHRCREFCSKLTRRASPQPKWYLQKDQSLVLHNVDAIHAYPQKISLTRSKLTSEAEMQQSTTASRRVPERERPK